MTPLPSDSLAGEEFPREWMEAMGAPPFLEPLERAERQRAQGKTIFPPPGAVFTALRLPPPRRVRAVLLGQDPYHEKGQAMGLAFAVPQGTKLPPSLQNIMREYAQDWDATPPLRPDLTEWARQGVLLLNTILTVEEGKPGSHAHLGWQTLTDQILRVCNALPHPVAFLLWGKHAQGKRSLIDESRHVVVAAPHPSPLSAFRGFFGSRPFTTTNQRLREKGGRPIQWTLTQDTLF